MDLDDRAVAAAEAGDARGDVQVLAAGVRVPGGAGTGYETDRATVVRWSASCGTTIGSSQTSPAKCSGGFLTVGVVGSMFMRSRGLWWWSFRSPPQLASSRSPSFGGVPGSALWAIKVSLGPFGS